MGQRGRELRIGERPGRQVRGQRPELCVRTRRVGLRHAFVKLLLGEPSLGETRPEHAHRPLTIGSGR
jgi:hypothetical protein